MSQLNLVYTGRSTRFMWIHQLCCLLLRQSLDGLSYCELIGYLNLASLVCTCSSSTIVFPFVATKLGLVECDFLFVEKFSS